jgi:hypothetical protein
MSEPESPSAPGSLAADWLAKGEEGLEVAHLVLRGGAARGLPVSMLSKRLRKRSRRSWCLRHRLPADTRQARLAALLGAEA